jgi:hypothetical protein
MAAWPERVLVQLRDTALWFLPNKYFFPVQLYPLGCELCPLPLSAAADRNGVVFCLGNIPGNDPLYWKAVLDAPVE